MAFVNQTLASIFRSAGSITEVEQTSSTTSQPLVTFRGGDMHVLVTRHLSTMTGEAEEATTTEREVTTATPMVIGTPHTAVGFPVGSGLVLGGTALLAVALVVWAWDTLGRSKEVETPVIPRGKMAVESQPLDVVMTDEEILSICPNMDFEMYEIVMDDGRIVRRASEVETETDEANVPETESVVEPESTAEEDDDDAPITILDDDVVGSVDEQDATAGEVDDE